MSYFFNKQLLFKGRYYFLWFTGLHRLLSDKTFINLQYRCNLNKKMNWENPRTFNEKLQWLKLNDHNPEYNKMVDKIEAKKYVADIIGEDHIIPTLVTYERIEDIEWYKLPNQFVMKCSHDSGGIIVCKDKEKLDIPDAIKKLKKSFKRNYYYFSREWAYKNVKPRILVEKYMTDNGRDLTDYKVHCFNGVPKVILVCKDRYESTGLTKDFFDEKWEHLDIGRGDCSLSTTPVKKPEELNEMLLLSKALSKNMSFCRTDFYTINHKVYFGEITLYPSGGMGVFQPQVWDELLGDWIELPSYGLGGQIVEKQNM